VSNISINKAVTQHSDQIPKEVKSVIKALDDDIRLAIIITLMENINMSFAELKKLLNIKSSSLSHHLTILQNGGLITNFLDLRGSHRSYYTTTDMTQSILGSLFDTVIRLPQLGLERHTYPTGKGKSGLEYSKFYEYIDWYVPPYTRRRFESPSSFTFSEPTMEYAATRS
jgi:DNA-binding transcriptional ArsR family regulator